MTLSDVASHLIAAKLSDHDGCLQAMGIKVGQLFTDHGLPIDMALARMDYSQTQKLAILDGSLQWLIEHKRRSGATDKAIERQRQANRRAVEHFLASGEVGLY